MQDILTSLASIDSGESSSANQRLAEFVSSLQFIIVDVFRTETLRAATPAANGLRLEQNGYRQHGPSPSCSMPSGDLMRHGLHAGLRCVLLRRLFLTARVTTRGAADRNTNIQHWAELLLLLRGSSVGPRSRFMIVVECRRRRAVGLGAPFLYKRRVAAVVFGAAVIGAAAMSKPNGTADSRPEHIQVGVRVRPLTPSEAQSGESVAWRVDGAVITQTDTAAKKAGKVPDFRCVRTAGPASLLLVEQYPRFQHVFGPGAKTSAVYEELVAPIVQDSLRGINGAVCCYGQTSAVRCSCQLM